MSTDFFPAREGDWCVACRFQIVAATVSEATSLVNQPAQ